MKIGIIGAGKMAQALARGFIASGLGNINFGSFEIICRAIPMQQFNV